MTLVEVTPREVKIRYFGEGIGGVPELGNLKILDQSKKLIILASGRPQSGARSVFAELCFKSGIGFCLQS
jgi:hypothetical protein